MLFKEKTPGKKMQLLIRVADGNLTVIPMLKATCQALGLARFFLSQPVDAFGTYSLVFLSQGILFQQWDVVYRRDSIPE